MGRHRQLQKKIKKKNGSLQTDQYFQQSYDVTHQPFVIKMKVRLLQAVLLRSTGQY
jgi:hypothetical protein